MTTIERATHTPGPWATLKVRNAHGVAVIPVNSRGKPRDGRETEDVCQCERDADAALISAAPELAEACRPAVEWGDKFNAPDDPTIVIELTREEFEAMKAALRKAGLGE